MKADDGGYFRIRTSTRCKDPRDAWPKESAPYGPGNDRRQKMTLLWKALAKHPVSKDILVYSRDEVDRWRDARNHTIAKALKEGRFLYGAL